MARCTAGEREVLDALHAAGAFYSAPGPYNTPRKAGIQRWRLFTRDERRTIHKALQPAGMRSIVAGGAGMLDELELLGFDVGGLWPERAR